MITCLVTCPPEIARQSLALRVIADTGARQVHQPRPKLSGLVENGGSSDAARILEYALPSGEVVLRIVRACGEIECWIRRDLATETLVRRSNSEADIAKVKAILVAEMNARDQKLADARGETLPHFREQRLHRGMKFERWQRAQRAGRG
jgi:hypothetical protein